MIKYVCAIGFYLSYPSFVIVKKTSAGQVLNTEFETMENAAAFYHRYNNDINQLQRVPNTKKAIILYFLQFFLTVPYVIILISALIILPWSIRHYFNWPWYQAVFGPCCLCLVQYAAVLNAIASTFVYISYTAPYFRPYKAPFILVGYITRTIKAFIAKFYKVVAKPLFDRLSECIKFAFHIVRNILSLTTRTLKTAIGYILKIIASSSGELVRSYIGILAYMTRLSLKFGLPGDIILTVFALLWMLWPLAIPMMLEEKVYYVPCALISIILVFVGYGKIQAISRGGQR